MTDSGGASPSASDQGSASLAFVLQLLGLPADAAQILHQSGKAVLSDVDLLRAARRFPVKARLIQSDVERLGFKSPMPLFGGHARRRLVDRRARPATTSS